ncbi:ATP-binding cassette domain-containing protein [Rhodobacter sp. NTK016B]|uniref:ABC transporter ATP-binding protein n=1 Tax=Rhodobacter sp. NTK016B TaxID=2759676 RepID=UPI001A8EFED7|nr:ATP-binding cassette domain-containing protein [Rhodobacter sp. NTK016B]MBN8291631.1 ATP-binding cassette domain-containing protein [Rhodobacter sp. NTK016B]
MIRATDLSKAFGPKQVLRGVGFTLEQGQSLVVIGGSGTGKSVLLRCLLGLERADSGTVEIAGLRNPKPQALAAHVGMLFQGAALFDSLPVWQNVAFRMLRGRQRAHARALAVEKLARVGLDERVADLYPAELSGGMQKRVGLARAIAGDPPILFFDEPTAGLDPIMAAVINALIRSVVTEMGATAVTITHDMTTLREVGDRVAMLHDGRIHWEGPAAEALTSEDPVMRQFTQGRVEGPIATLR